MRPSGVLTFPSVIVLVLDLDSYLVRLERYQARLLNDVVAKSQDVVA